ncbi:cytidine deaminase [Teleopsis dalmanni]|uniref:cytidine deaminase n=1 Tax=Teleopsis dalmanni TaxID=139649 RepID=UPI0018CDFC53|nr:cytidine deaminase [Teleopsis dalmanni]
MAGFFVNGKDDEDYVKLYDNLDVNVQKLINAAIEVRRNAYCPYSSFAVGAAIRTTDGSIYTGCNIENGAFVAGICAERVAAAKAITEGKREFVDCAVVASVDAKHQFTTPCGVCRQFLSEFVVNKDISIYATVPINPPLRVLCTSVMGLLPKSFSCPINRNAL